MFLGDWLVYVGWRDSGPDGSEFARRLAVKGGQLGVGVCLGAGWGKESRWVGYQKICVWFMILYGHQNIIRGT